MDQSTKKTGLLNLAVLLAATLVLFAMSRYLNSGAALMGSILSGYGLLVALLGYFHTGMLEREALEKMEMDELSKSRGQRIAL